ncbi:MAG: PAS domain S-box protein [Anaerolineae bacterium]
MSGERILVVHNEPAALRLCAETMAQGGFQVEKACSEEEALDRLQRERFNLLLLDLAGVDAAGVALLPQARALDPALLVVVMVAGEMLPQESEVLRAGAWGFVLKPYEPDDLLRAARQALEEQRQGPALFHAGCPIYDIFQAALQGGDVRSRGARLLDVARRQVSADQAALLLLDDELEELYLAGLAGLPAEATVGLRLPLQGTLRQALAWGQPWMPGKEAVRSDPFLQLLVDGSHLHGTWVVPLSTNEKAVGVFVFSYHGDNQPLAQSKGLLAFMSDQMAIALQNAQLFERVDYLKTFNENIVQSLEEGILLENATGHITFVNPRTAELLGYAADELLGRRWTAIVAPECAAKVFAESVKRPQGIAGRYETVLLTKGGRRVPVIASARPLFDDGRYTGTVVVFTDITDRKQAEETLRESRHLLQATFTGLRDAVFILETGTTKAGLPENPTIIDCNPAATEIFGYSREEMLGRTTEFLHSDGAALEEFRRHLHAAVERSGFLSSLEFKMRRKNGNLFYTEHSVMPLLDKEEKRFGWMSVVRDITTRRTAQETLERRNEELRALNAISTTMSQMLSLEEMLDETLDRLLEVIDIGGGWIQLLDDESEDLLMVSHRGFSPEMIEEARTIKLGESLTGRVAQSGQPIVLGKVSDDPRLKTDAVRREDLHFFAGIPIKSHEQVLGVLGVFSRRPRTLSSQKVQILTAVGHQLGIAIENVRLANKATENEICRELDRLRSDLIANVSHELRTPLGLIKLACTTLQREDVDVDRETQLEFLRDIREESDKLERLVSDLLDLSQRAGGGLSLDKHSVDVGRLVSRVTKGMEAQFPNRRFVDDVPTAPLVAAVDAERLEQVLRNLLSNAIKYSPQDGIISVRCHRDDGQIAISVSDEGIGIPAEDLEQVFERFYRVDNEVTRHERGAGLGLAVCRDIVEAHGGRIWIESTPGQGATVHIRLPADSDPPGEPRLPCNG